MRALLLVLALLLLAFLGGFCYSTARAEGVGIRKPEIIGFANHNPGNIRAHSVRGWRGATGLDPWLHIIFESDLDGLRAMRRVLTAYHRKHKLKTVEAIAWRWMGPAKTETERKQKLGYIRAICQHTGLKATDSIDLSDRYMMIRLAKAIVIGECGSNPYPDSLYMQAFGVTRIP